MKGRRCKIEFVKLKDKFPSCQCDILNMIDSLREEEPSSVTLNHDNPDFNGQPNCSIDVCGEWTNYEQLRFEGETIRCCLKYALDAKLKKEKVK